MRVGVHLGEGEVEYVRLGMSIHEREGHDDEQIQYSFAGQ
jgi:hypothetical protein